MKVYNTTYPANEEKSLTADFETFIKSYKGLCSDDEDERILQFAEPHELFEEKVRSSLAYGWIAADPSPAVTYITIDKHDGSVSLSLWAEPIPMEMDDVIDFIKSAKEDGDTESLLECCDMLIKTYESYKKGQVLVVFFDVDLTDEERNVLMNLK